MKQSYLYGLLTLILFILGYMIYGLHSNQPRFACIDTHQIIRTTAEGFAKARLTEDHLHARLAKFKKDLETAMDAFASEQRVILIPSHLTYGNITDMTEQFIAFHNGEAR